MHFSYLNLKWYEYLCLIFFAYMQIRQSAAVMLRLRVKKHWKKINPNDRERFFVYLIHMPGIEDNCL